MGIVGTRTTRSRCIGAIGTALDPDLSDKDVPLITTEDHINTRVYSAAARD